MSEHNHIEGAAAEPRVLLVSRMLAAPEAGALSHRAVTDTLDNVLDYLGENGLTQADLARGLGTNEAYISTLFGGDRESLPRGKLDELTRAANAWIEQDFAIRQTARARRLVETEVVRKILTAAGNVVRGLDMGVVVGPSGVGKSETMNELPRLFPGAILIRATPDSATASGFLSELFRCVRLKKRTRRHVRLSDVIDRLKGSNRLLAIDDAHLLKDRVFPILIALHDYARLPILLFGTANILKRVTEDEDVLFGQLASRVGIRVSLLEGLGSNGKGRSATRQWIGVSEIRKLFETKLKLHHDAARLLALIACTSIGHLRRAAKVARWAETFALSDKRSGGTIGVCHVERAHKLVAGEEAPVDHERMDVATQTQVAAG